LRSSRKLLNRYGRIFVKTLTVGYKDLRPNKKGWAFKALSKLYMGVSIIKREKLVKKK